VRRNPNYVPPLPRRTICRDDRCDVEIAFLTNPETGRKIPVETSSMKADDREYDKARHVSHFTNCPGANDFSRNRKREPQADAFAEDARREMGIDHDDDSIGNK